MTKKIASFVWIFATVALAGSARADHYPDIMDATARSYEPADQIRVASTNLSQMRASLLQSEQATVDSIICAVNSFSGIRSEIQTVGIIFGKMEAPADQKFVAEMFEHTAGLLVIRARYDIEKINPYLAQLTTPAALVEATKLRDGIMKFRDIVSPFALR